MEEHDTNWVKVLSELCIGDAFGHESWFIIGIEQRKRFFYCFIGDYTATPEDGWEILDKGKPKSESAKCFTGCHPDHLDAAVIHALAAAFSYLAQLPRYEAVAAAREGYLNAWWKLLPLAEKEKLIAVWREPGESP